MAEIVVLSHVARRELWGSVPDVLEAAHTVTFLDVPGFGDTPLPDGLPPTIETMAEGVRRELTARGLTGAHLVGLSMAGTVALEPAWLRAVVWGRLVAHPERVPAPAAVATVMGIPRNMRFLTSPATLPALTRALVAYRVCPIVGKVPVTVAWGDRDAFTSYRTQEPRTRVVLPQARHVTLRGCGHVPSYDDPEQVARVILESVDGRG